MREIKFRGLDDKGIWHFGNYVNASGFHLILTQHRELDDGESIPDFCSSVMRENCIKKETKGQYTGLKDKNGKEIYEGDVVVLSFGKHWWKFECKSVNGTSLYFIELSNNCATEGYGDEERYTFKECTVSKGRRKDIAFVNSKEIEKLGNIHENPELLIEEK